MVACILIPLNTTHAFWGDMGDKYVSVAIPLGEGVTESDIQLKDIKSMKKLRGAYRVYEKSDFRSGIGTLTKEKDIKLVKKYLGVE